VLLAHQDRSRWDRARIDRGLTWLDRIGSLDRAGP
jgi:predicted RNA polymerase sigma factor